VYWQLTALGVACEVVAPSLVPLKGGDRVKTYMTWIKEQVRFDQPALEAKLLDYVHEVDHMAERIQRLEKAITEAIQKAPPPMRAVIEALQALRGVAQITAVTVVAELGTLSRFASPRQLMGYSGWVSSEFSMCGSAGDRTRARGKENPPTFYAVRSSGPIRVPRPRQLPTDHDCAVRTRGYQIDQPSHLPLVLSPALPAPGLVQLPPNTKVRFLVGLNKVAPYLTCPFFLYQS
jgi:hypothetical protein